MNLRALLGVLCTAALLAGCGGFDCSDKGQCANDVGPSQTEVAQCEARVGDPSCGNKYEDYAKCYLDNEQCTANGDSDVNNTNAKCIDSYTALQTCCAISPTSASCG